MSDLRALLKQQQTARRVSHPLAVYSGSTLSCAACGIAIKSEALWPAHEASPNHREAAKKRRTDENEDGERKKARSDEPRRRSGPLPGVEIALASRPATPRESQTSSFDGTPDVAAPAQQNQADNAVDESEWAAFEAEMAEPAAPSAVTHVNTFVISAPAKTAAQVAEEKEAEAAEPAEPEVLRAADEREEAARALEVEMDDMAELERRVQELKQRREAVRPRQGARVIARERTPVATDSEGDGDSDDDWLAFR